MKFLFRKLLLVMALCCFAVSSMAETAEKKTMAEEDSLEVGFLTCSPGQEVYELYGHTALRIRNKRNGDDWVFNYGVFDFRTPNFAWRFMLGQTDYMLGVVPFDAFAASYARSGRSVEEQVLNLTPLEKNCLWESLVRTASTPGWTYRYNFLYDNCTTRAVEEVGNCLQGKIVWKEINADAGTFRDIIHEFASAPCPWNAFGQDLILGEEVDKPIGRKEKMFSPVYARRYFDKAQIEDADGVCRPLVLRTERVVDAMPEAATHFPVSPLMAVLILAVVMLALGMYERKRGRVFALVDYLWMLVWGGTGCIVFILFFFSEHPAVGSNWLVVLLNPLPLLMLPVKIWRDRHHQKDYFPLAASVAIVVFGLLGLFMPQQVPVLFYAILLILLLRYIYIMVWSQRIETLRRQKIEK